MAKAARTLTTALNSSPAPIATSGTIAAGAPTLADKLGHRFGRARGGVSPLSPHPRPASTLEFFQRKPKVVIVGSGWAGFTFLKTLDARLYDITVLSNRSYFVFTPLLASTTVGTLEFRTALENVRAQRKGDFQECKVEGVDFARRKVRCTPALESMKANDKDAPFEVSYDHLILTPGCYSNTFNIPGVKEHARFLKDVKDARDIRRRILKCFEEAHLPTTSDAERRRLLTFCVVGAGPTGVEFMAELRDLVREDMAKLYPESLLAFVSYHIYDVAEQILATFDKRLAAYATQKFQRAEIQIHTRTSPVEVTDRELVFDGGREAMPYGLLVWSTGLAPNTLVKNLRGVAKDPRSGGLLTNHYLQCKITDSSDDESRSDTTGAVGAAQSPTTTPAPGLKLADSPRASEYMPNVYALGDCGVTENDPLPATAQVASQKARYLAKAFNASALGGTVSPFSFKDRGIMAYLGANGAIVQPGSGGAISGFMAYLIWRFAYVSMTVSLRNKLLVPVYWSLNRVFGRDINRF